MGLIFDGPNPALPAAAGGGTSLSDATPAALGTAAAGVSTSASRADHVHEAPAGGTAHTSGTLAALPASPAAGDTYAVTTGFARGDRYRCYVAGTWEPLVEYFDFSSSTGWTLQNNLGSASITGGIARVATAVDPSLRTNAGGYTYGGPAVTRALPAGYVTLDVMVRISSMSLAASSFAHLEVGDALSAGTRRSVIVDHAGGFIFYANNLNTNIAFSGAGSAFASYTGEEWIRLTQAGGTLTAYTGVGVAGALPTTWTSRGSTSIATVWTHVALSMQSHSGAGTRTIEFDDLLIRWGD